MAKARAQGARRALALQNGGVGDGTAAPPPAAPPGGKARGKGKSKNADNKPLCYAWNNGQQCRNNPCNFVHECQLCLSKDHPKIRCSQFGGA